MLQNNNYLKERLNYLMELRKYYFESIHCKKIFNKARDLCLKDKPYLSLLLSLYYLPINTFKYLGYLKDLYYFQRVDMEIKLINDEIDNKNK